MTARRPPMIFLALAAVAALAGCGKSAVKSADEALSLPFRGVRAGVREIGKGVGKIGENVVTRLITDRNRAQLVREHRDTRAHLKLVETRIERRKIALGRSESRLIQDSNDRLAAIGLQLEAERIPAGVGQRMYRQLDGVRQSLDLIRRRHNTPRYTGFIADR